MSRRDIIDETLQARSPAPLVTAEEAAEELSVPVGTIRSWVSRGRLTPAGISHQRTKLFKLAEVEALATRTRRRTRGR